MIETRLSFPHPFVLNPFLGQSDGSTAQHQLVQQQINVIPSPAIVNAQKLQRTDRLEVSLWVDPWGTELTIDELDC